MTEEARPDLQRIAIVTDAWHPQVNGVVRTVVSLVDELRAIGHTVEVIDPTRFRTVACPTYREIRLAVLPGRRLRGVMDRFRPDALHIATEGPLGHAARRWARARGLRFTTSLHTRFPDYIEQRIGVPARLGWWLLRRFHAAGSGTLVATKSLHRELDGRGFINLRHWSRGVDVALFRPEPRENWPSPRPVFLYVGRIAVEKNILAFLDLELPGSKVVVGDGPLLPELRQRFPGVTFTGTRHNEALARAYAGADVFVFPSRTDTFGLVMLESMACGTPVAAYPVPGPLDVLPEHGGALDNDLRKAAMKAMAISRADCRAYAERHSWRRCAEQFLHHLVPLRS